MKKVETLLLMLGLVFILSFWLATREEKVTIKSLYYIDATYDAIAYTPDTLSSSAPRSYWNGSSQPYGTIRAK